MAQRPVPPRGMRDLLPREVVARRYLLDRMIPAYERYGFVQIETPALEELDRLIGSEGGDNEKLIFKVLKRGLTFGAPITDDRELVDLGLRYDLTVPLARYFATHSAELLMPFRAIQIGPVWRAERPQKGRYRQFMQCDIDTLGDPTVAAEIELVCATAEALAAVEVGAFTVRINDRRLLDGLMTSAGFAAEVKPGVLVALDKYDKIGLAGVAAELESISPGAPARRMVELVEALVSARGFESTLNALPDAIDVDVVGDLQAIVEASVATLPWLNIELDATLVRGQGYYTGTIFEVEHDELSGSLAGGGRYDRMIGKLSGAEVPAVGFSIGFERLFDILGDKVQTTGRRSVVLLAEKNVDPVAVHRAAQSLRNGGDNVRVDVAAKNRNAQTQRFVAAGFTHYASFSSQSISDVLPLVSEETS